MRIPVVLTWFHWTLLAFVEPPGGPYGPTTLLLLGEAWQSLPTLMHTYEVTGEQEKHREGSLLVFRFYFRFLGFISYPSKYISTVCMHIKNQVHR